jgi:tetratricopeptide (TPR) repeat protein
MNPQAKTLFDQGEAYSKKKSWDLAIAAYQQAVRIEPKFAEAWNNMGYCYRKAKQFDKALDAYKQAITLKPDFSYPHEYMARTYLAMGNKDAAMREYEILKRLDGKMADGLLKAIQANNPDLGDDD